MENPSPAAPQGGWSPGDIGRRWWRAGKLNDLSATSETLEEVHPDQHGTANLVSSLCTDGLHAPVLDLDHRARLIPSTTEGHAHLYIEERITWARYRALLRGLYKAGLIDASVYWRSLDRESTYVRPPWVRKTEAERALGSIEAPLDPRAARVALRRVRSRVLRRWPGWLLAEAANRARSHRPRRAV